MKTKKKFFIKAVFYLFSLCLLGFFTACVTVVPPEDRVELLIEPEPPETFVPAALPEIVQPEKPLPTDGLDSEHFLTLPRAAREYLKILSDAFRNKDKDFLLAQGETLFERDMRPRFDDEVYLAMLFRIGPFSTGSTMVSPILPRLYIAEVSSIEYLEWEESGPILEISGRLIMEREYPIPVLIKLIWKLEEPKILGIRP